MLAQGSGSKMKLKPAHFDVTRSQICSFRNVNSTPSDLTKNNREKNNHCEPVKICSSM